jgi:hypothetical protein
VIHCAVGVVLEALVLDPAAEVVLWVAVVAVPVLVAAVLAVVVVVVFLAAVVVPVLEVVVLCTDVVLATPVLAVVAEVFWVVAGAGVWVESVCANIRAAETKPQARMMIKRFMVHPFKDVELGKVSSPDGQFKN